MLLLFFFAVLMGRHHCPRNRCLPKVGPIDSRLHHQMMAYHNQGGQHHWIFHWHMKVHLSLDLLPAYGFSNFPSSFLFFQLCLLYRVPHSCRIFLLAAFHCWNFMLSGSSLSSLINVWLELIVQIVFQCLGVSWAVWTMVNRIHSFESLLHTIMSI